jgi:hypothetical protein
VIYTLPGNFSLRLSPVEEMIRQIKFDTYVYTDV